MFRTIMATLVLFLVSCAHYDAAAIKALSEKNLVADAVTSEMCEDFAVASTAASEGEDTAYPLLGKAYEIKSLAMGLKEHSVQCVEVVSRLANADRPLPEAHHTAILNLFKKSWDNAKKLVE